MTEQFASECIMVDMHALHVVEDDPGLTKIKIGNEIVCFT